MKVYKKTPLMKKIEMTETMELEKFIPRKTVSEECKIPKRVVRCMESYTVNEIYKRCHDSVIQNCQDFDIYHFDDEDCEKFVQENFSEEVLMAFRTLIPGAYKADLFRLCYLYINGGFYIDFNKNLLAPLSKFFSKDDDFVSVVDRPQDSIWQGFIGCVPGLPFIKNCIDRITENVKNKFYGESDLDVTGPCLVGKVYREVTGLPISIGRHSDNSFTYNFICKFDGKNILTAEGGSFLLLNLELRSLMGLTLKKSHYSYLWQIKNIYA